MKNKNIYIAAISFLIGIIIIQSLGHHTKLRNLDNKKDDIQETLVEDDRVYVEYHSEDPAYPSFEIGIYPETENTENIDELKEKTLRDVIILNQYNRLTCARCDEVVLLYDELLPYKKYELEIMRNEIFARHGYNFENDRLNEFFYDYRDQPETPLNDVEEKNSTLMKQRENEIDGERKELLASLQAIKKKYNQTGKIKIKDPESGLHEIAYDESQIGYMLETIGDILARIDFDDVHWYKDSGYHRLAIDNGSVIDNFELHIRGNQIELSQWIGESSEIIPYDDVFKYPSNFYSEFDEYSEVFFFEFDGEEISFIDWFAAG